MYVVFREFPLNGLEVIGQNSKTYDHYLNCKDLRDIDSTECSFTKILKISKEILRLDLLNHTRHEGWCKEGSR